MQAQACFLIFLARVHCTLLQSRLGQCCHISEEVEDASLVVPRCMFWSFIYNLAISIVMLIVMLCLHRTARRSCKSRKFIFENRC